MAENGDLSKEHVPLPTVLTWLATAFSVTGLAMGGWVTSVQSGQDRRLDLLETGVTTPMSQVTREKIDGLQTRMIEHWANVDARATDTQRQIDALSVQIEYMREHQCR